MTKETNNLIEFTLLFNRYKTRLYNYALKMTSDKMTSEDLVQNVFLRLYENLPSIKNRDSILFWLFTTLRNEIYSFFRRKKIYAGSFSSTSADELEVSSGFNLIDEFELNEVKDIISTELNKLAADQREVFILKEYGGLSYKEIAALLDINENLVKSRLYNIRQKLLEKISKVI